METVPFYTILNPLMMAGIVALQIFAVVLLLGLLRVPHVEKIVRPVGHRALTFSFLLSLAALLGSLYYSEVAGYAACELCWWQRIFIYPQVILYSIALWYGRKDVIFYAGALSVIGLGYALYNIAIQSVASLSAFCEPGSLAASCLEKYVEGFGYITIPVMSATTLVVLLLLGWAGVRTHDLSLTKA